MELIHLRYFLTVGEASSFTKAAAQLRVAQSALSRQVQELEDEIGVDLLRCGPRGAILTAEGRLFLEEAREQLKRTDESVEKVRALVRGEYGELRVGQVPTSTLQILPPAIAELRKSVLHATVFLHDLSTDERIAGLRNGTLELSIIPECEQTAGIELRKGLFPDPFDYGSVKRNGAPQQGAWRSPYSNFRKDQFKRQVDLNRQEVVDLAHSYYEHLAAPKHQQDRNDQALFEALGRSGLKDDDNAQRITIHKVTHLWRAKRPEEIISAESTNSCRPLKL